MKLNKHLQSLRILVAEDEEIIRNELAEILEWQVEQLLFAKNGREGLEIYKQQQPHIVISDVRMPLMDGLEMAHEILLIDSHQPIIIISAFNESEFLLKAIKEGIKYYLIKPVDIRQLFNIIEEITHNRLLDRQLAEANQLLRQYKQIVDDTAIVSKTDPIGKITYANSAFEKISGYQLDELLGKSHNIVRHPDTDASIFKHLWQTIKSHQVWKGVVKNQKKDGNEYIVESHIYPILSPHQEVTEFLSFHYDVTDREQALQLLSSELESSCQSVDEKVAFINEYEKALRENTLFCRISLDGTIITSSHAFCALIGYSFLDLKGQDYKLLVKNKNIYKTQLEAILNTGKTWQGSITHRKKNGDYLCLESALIPITALNGSTHEILIFYVDLTEIEKLHKERLESQKEIIAAMGAIGETRSKETGDHVKRVADYSEFLALKAGLSHKQAAQLKMASPMHDIGKVGIEDAILNKPGKLTDEEFEIMKTHASLGHEMLKNSNQPLLKMAATIALTHHEKWDGSGYPQALRGKEIPIIGRITAIADVFDALGHDRVYKKAWPLEDILALFRSQRGLHFDPMLVDLVFQHLDDLLEIKTLYDGKPN